MRCAGKRSPISDIAVGVIVASPALTAIRAARKTGKLPASPQQTAARLQKATPLARTAVRRRVRSEEHTSELQSLMRISYAVFCLTKNTHTQKISKYNASDLHTR